LISIQNGQDPTARQMHKHGHFILEAKEKRVAFGGTHARDQGHHEYMRNAAAGQGVYGVEIELINAVRAEVTIPEIASSGAGCAEHFLEVPTGEVKAYLTGKVDIRPV